MANPQKENGYTAIANSIMDALIAAALSGQDFRIALLIIRKTYGFNKCEDAVSLSQMMKATGMLKVRCSQVVNRLELMKILTVTENINGMCKKYKFNKDFDTWQTVNKNINCLEKTKGTVNKKRNRPLMKSVTTKDTLTKDTLTKDIKILSRGSHGDGIPYQEIVLYLNKKTLKEFSHKSKKTMALIRARWNEGHTLEDFKRVVDIKCAKWLVDPKYIDYLRPITLFGEKFESYLNEITHPDAGKYSDTTIKNIQILNDWRPPT
jgi:phage replication O-like protein O